MACEPITADRHTQALSQAAYGDGSGRTPLKMVDNIPFLLTIPTIPMPNALPTPGGAAIVGHETPFDVFGPVKPMARDNDRELRETLATLRAEHRALDTEIIAIEAAGNIDQLNISRLKKRKLRLKDQISTIEDQLFPDIIA
jgi:hypothetical protein